MRLKRLELFGFKSFADRTVFEFGDQTLTGVVGPNGCGKSNVVDSVRWVLGEQRPTSMRGSEMTDVIFKGSTSRPALSVAEVTLILDNGSARLENRGAEVAITRRVFLSGEGEYLIDGDPVRLKDVREMLFDTGLGSRGYSVLEQGRIDAVLSANPLERRRIFEEAAGISRYRQRKVEAETRLSKVADDMARLDDLLGELTTRVRSLKIQAGKAERFVAARDEWAREKARLFRHELWIAGRDLEGLTRRLRGIEGTLARAKAERALSEERAATLERSARACRPRSSARRTPPGAWRGTAARSTSAARTSRRASRGSRRRARGGRARRAARGRARGARRRARTARDRARRAGRRGRGRGATGGPARPGARGRGARRAGRTRETRGGARGGALDPGRDEPRGEPRAVAGRDPRARVGARRAGARAACGVAARPGGAGRGGQRARGRGAAQRSGARRERGGPPRARARGPGARGRSTAGGPGARGPRGRPRPRAEPDRVPPRPRARPRGALEAARTLLEGAGPAAGPTDLCGLVADHLRTDVEHARALDAALAARGRAIVARDRDAARSVAAWLKARETGQIGLVLGAGLAPSPRAVPPAFGADEAELLRGRLLDRVRTTSGCERLAEILVGDVHVARDLDAAIALAERHPELRFVTLEGDLADAAGLLAGSGALTQGAVGRRSSAADLALDLERISARIAALEGSRAAMAVRQAALEARRETAGVRLEEALAARSDAESRLATARARHEDVDLDRGALETQSEGATAEVAELEADLAAETRVRDETTVRHEASRFALAALERELGEREAARAEAARAAAEARVLAARARERLEGLARRRADLAAVLSENRREMERARRLAGDHAEQARATRAEIETVAGEAARVQEERGRVEEHLRGLRARHEIGSDSLAAARGATEALQRDLDRTQAELSEERLAEQRLALTRTEIVRRAADELALDEAALLDGFVPEPELAEAPALAELARGVQEQKERLDKLGPVNMEAMAELAEVGGRLEYLQAQRDDLARAREALGSTLKTIDAESKRLFLETFEAVRENFQRIFRQLFGGGRAEVSLEEGADVLEAGVEIVARPPGRELLPIGLLSGGQRTLTALALLFAVFEARPSPFCILDEVDAALDDANVERFLAMLDGYRASTQFIVVTHNKGTMAACQGLYGVTMETKGVSRQVAVELDEVDRWSSAPPPAADPGPAAGADPAGPTLDPESGEPLVEIVPVEGNGSAPARARRARARRSVRADEAPAAAASAAPEALD
jgi:chromosome segregation protein